MEAKVQDLRSRSGKHTKVMAAVQARMGSSRLPKKAILLIAGRSTLEWIILRLKSCRQLDGIVLSTTAEAEDDVLERLTRKLGIPCFRGSETDLVQRLLGTATTFGADALVRITGDCPLVDPRLVDRMVDEFRRLGDCVDLLTNVYPPTYPDGLDIEILPTSVLERLEREVESPFYRECLTRHIMDNPNKFRIVNIPCKENLAGLRWTLDYPEDLEFISSVYLKLKNLNGLFGMEDILELLKQDPKLGDINKHVTQDGPSRIPECKGMMI
jgi:spore coat polysaccharide biosynthesis protein SpsF